MIKHVLTVFLCVWLWSLPALAADPPWASGASRGQDLDIELMTFGVGDDIPSWWGHTAIAVRDRRLKQERVYNFGMFHFGPDMLPKFLMGRLEFWVGQGSYARTVRLYAELDRDVTVQVLNLDPDQRLAVAQRLAWNVLPENRTYLYDHYFDNCATRIRDLIDMGTGGQFKRTTDVPARMTLRDHVHRHTERNLYIDLILTFWMNGKIDEPIHEWDEMYLPSELALRVGKQKFVNGAGEIVPLVAETRVLHVAKNRTPVPEWPMTKVPWLVLVGAVIGGVAWWLARRLASQRAAGQKARGARVAFGAWNVVAGLLIGIPGLILPLFNFTDHVIAKYNYNVLLASPLTFLAIPLGVGVIFGSKRAERWLGACWNTMVFASALGIVLALVVTQVMRQPIALIVPINVGFAVAFWRLKRTP